MAFNTAKNATPQHPIHELLVRRYSPYCFDPRPVETAKLLSCFEAARWAASSYNEQPWRFMLSLRQEPAEFERMLACLLPANQEWARNAGVLLLTAVSTTFSHNGKPNRVAVHDLGLAAGNLSLQATAVGLHVHHMAGVDLQRIRETYGIPQGYEPVTAIAIGYAADPAARPVDDPLAVRDCAPRPRRVLADFVFSGQWGQPAALA